MPPSFADTQRKARLALILRARSNPRPGRQVVSAEGMREYGLPIGSDIPPGMRKLTPNQQAEVAALTSHQRGLYMAYRHSGTYTHAEAVKQARRAATPGAAKPAQGGVASEAFDRELAGQREQLASTGSRLAEAFPNEDDRRQAAVRLEGLRGAGSPVSLGNGWQGARDRRLVDAGLAEVRGRGRSQQLVLTDAGWRALGAEPPGAAKATTAKAPTAKRAAGVELPAKAARDLRPGDVFEAPDGSVGRVTYVSPSGGGDVVIHYSDPLLPDTAMNRAAVRVSGAERFVVEKRAPAKKSPRPADAGLVPMVYNDDPDRRARLEAAGVDPTPVDSRDIKPGETFHLEDRRYGDNISPLRVAGDYMPGTTMPRYTDEEGYPHVLVPGVRLYRPAKAAQPAKVAPRPAQRPESAPRTAPDSEVQSPQRVDSATWKSWASEDHTARASWLWHQAHGEDGKPGPGIPGRTTDDIDKESRFHRVQTGEKAKREKAAAANAEAPAPTVESLRESVRRERELRTAGLPSQVPPPAEPDTWSADVLEQLRAASPEEATAILTDLSRDELERLGAEHGLRLGKGTKASLIAKAVAKTRPGVAPAMSREQAKERKAWMNRTAEIGGALTDVASGDVATMRQRLAVRTLLPDDVKARLEYALGTGDRAEIDRVRAELAAKYGLVPAGRGYDMVVDGERLRVSAAAGRDPVPAPRAPRKAAAPRARESVFGGPMSPGEELLHGLTAAEVAQVAEELNVPAPVADSARGFSTVRRWPAGKEARIRYLLTTLDEGRNRGGFRAFGRGDIEKAVETVTSRRRPKQTDMGAVADRVRQAESPVDAVWAMEGLSTVHLRDVADRLEVELPPNLRTANGMRLYLSDRGRLSSLGLEELQRLAASRGIAFAGLSREELLARLRGVARSRLDLQDVTRKAKVAAIRRAAGADVTPGQDQLHHWWTKGPGLARWAASPHPWRTLRAALTEVLAEHGRVVSPEQLNSWVSAWVKEVTGLSTGDDRYRLRYGGKIRGHRIGKG